MENNRMMLVLMVLLTIAAFGGVLFAYIHGAPMLAVLYSFSSLVINYIARTNIIKDTPAKSPRTVW